MVRTQGDTVGHAQTADYLLHLRAVVEEQGAETQWQEPLQEHDRPGQHGEVADVELVLGHKGKVICHLQLISDRDRPGGNTWRGSKRRELMENEVCLF